MNILTAELNGLYQSMIEGYNDFLLRCFNSEAMAIVDNLKENCPHSLDLNDLGIFEHLCNGKCPNFKNTPLQRFVAIPSLVQEFAPCNFNDFILLCAINRIGQLKWAEKILESRKSDKPQDNIEKIADILAESYGVIIYHEQLIDIIQSLTGFYCSEAEILISFMGRIRFKGYEQAKELFILHAMAHSSIARHEAENIWRQLRYGYDFSLRKNDVIRGALILYRAIFYTLKAK